MTNVRKPTRDLKTRNKEAYAELSPNIGGQKENVTYPFSTGFALFSASLVVGYMNDDGDLIEEEAERRYEEDEEEDDDTEEESAEEDTSSISSDEDEGDDDSDNEEDDSYHRFTDMQQVLDNNEDHAYTIELIDRIIALELASQSDNEDEEIPEDVWNLVVAHADKGVGIIRQEWKTNSKIELDDRFDELENFWQEKIENISGELTQIPVREDDGLIETGD